MGLIVAILLGALVGHVAAKLMGRDTGFVASAVVGVIGAIVGNVISRLLLGSAQAGLAFDWSSLLWALGGSVVVVLIWNSLQDRGKRI